MQLSNNVEKRAGDGCWASTKNDYEHEHLKNKKAKKLQQKKTLTWKLVKYWWKNKIELRNSIRVWPMHVYRSFQKCKAQY